MEIIRNFPFFSIMLCMFGAILSSVLSGRAARRLSYCVLSAVDLLSVVLLVKLHSVGESFVYYMGHFPAPWGNEIRAGGLEALMAVFVSTVALLAILGGRDSISSDVEPEKKNLFYILTDLMVASLLALIYTNDLFTAYVFIEINTIAGCGLIMIRQNGKSIVTAVRYMVVSLLGSGLFLIGVTLLYTVTGHLLMPNIRTSVEALTVSGDYRLTLTVILALMTVGLAIKSGLFPFHMWIPDAYGNSNVASSSMLSGIVSKGYIILLIKIYYRVIGIEYVRETGILNIIYVFGVIAMMIGSIMAIREDSVRRVIAYSSIAQIGYIYMGIGLGSDMAVVAAFYHILAHGCTKSLLFIASSEFTEGSHSKKLRELYGLGRKYKYSSFAFSVGALSMIGFPLLSGFISKLLFSNASIGMGSKTFVSLIALAVSTILNAIYFIRMIVCLYSKHYLYMEGNMVDVSTLPPDEAAETIRELKTFTDSDLIQSSAGKYRLFTALAALVIINFLLGMNGETITGIIEAGLRVFD